MKLGVIAIALLLIFLLCAADADALCVRGTKCKPGVHCVIAHGQRHCVGI